jgi:hypothetical protein
LVPVVSIDGRQAAQLVVRHDFPVVKAEDLATWSSPGSKDVECADLEMFDPALKIEPFDILLVKYERFAEEDVISFYLKLAEPAAFEIRHSRLEITFGHCHGRMHGQISQVLRIPQNDRWSDAFADISFVVIRQAQAYDFHVFAATLFDGLGSARHRR